MTKNKRFLVVQPDPEKAAQIQESLQTDGGFEVILIQSAMESIAAFSDHQPDQVLLSVEDSEIPPEMLVNGFREMNPMTRIWLCSDRRTEPLETLCARMDAMGTVVLPVTPEDCLYFSQAIPNEGPKTEAFWIDETMTDSSLDLSGGQPARGLPARISARELENRDSFMYQGDLSISGTLQNMPYLEVTGNLVVEGDVINVGVRCGGSLVVEGRIKWCREKGLFCKGMMEVGDVADSLLVCGANFYLNGVCRSSRVEALLRFVGKTEKARLVGGYTRVGEYLEIAGIGDKDQTETAIDLAAPRYFQAWARARRRIWRQSLLDKPRADQAATFKNLLSNPDFFQRQARLRADKIHSGLTIRIGEHEDYIFENHLSPVLISIGQKYKHRQGIRVETLDDLVKEGAFRDVV